jgi:hypothetical protein
MDYAEKHGIRSKIRENQWLRERMVFMACVSKYEDLLWLAIKLQDIYNSKNFRTITGRVTKASLVPFSCKFVDWSVPGRSREAEMFQAEKQAIGGGQPVVDDLKCVV